MLLKTYGYFHVLASAMHRSMKLAVGKYFSLIWLVLFYGYYSMFEKWSKYSYDFKSYGHFGQL